MYHHTSLFIRQKRMIPFIYRGLYISRSVRLIRRKSSHGEAEDTKRDSFRDDSVEFTVPATEAGKCTNQGPSRPVVQAVILGSERCRCSCTDGKQASHQTKMQLEQIEIGIQITYAENFK
jgi:hypothetical protein